MAGALCHRSTTNAVTTRGSVTTAERTITVVRGRNVRVAQPMEVAVVASRADQAAAAAASFTSGVADVGEAHPALGGSPRRRRTLGRPRSS